MPNPNGFTAVLPYWFREGDWILEPNKLGDFRGHVLVLREVADGFYSPILGRGRVISGARNIMADANFRIFWDAEDLLIHALVDDWSSGFFKKPVDVGVCKRDSPGSSYAIRQKQR